MPSTKTRTVPFEASPWRASSARAVPAKRVTVEISREDIKEATWSRFNNPVSIALQEHLAQNTCADLFWNSDGFTPRYPDDDARIGIHQEVLHPQTGRLEREEHYHLPLPRRATRAMWLLRKDGIDTFSTIRMAVDLPTACLRPRT